jgi:hypothetical protein
VDSICTFEEDFERIGNDDVKAAKKKIKVALLILKVEIYLING